jgi:hypothetical protein
LEFLALTTEDAPLGASVNIPGFLQNTYHIGKQCSMIRGAQKVLKEVGLHSDDDQATCPSPRPQTCHLPRRDIGMMHGPWLQAAVMMKWSKVYKNTSSYEAVCK